MTTTTTPEKRIKGFLKIICLKENFFTKNVLHFHLSMNTTSLFSSRFGYQHRVNSRNV